MIEIVIKVEETANAEGKSNMTTSMRTVGNSACQAEVEVVQFIEAAVKATMEMLVKQEGSGLMVERDAEPTPEA